MLCACLAGCTETRYAAHLAKQIPMPGEVSKTQGTFKVGNPYTVAGRIYYPKENYNHVETGIASWYGPGFHGKRTANGEIFDTGELTAAHKTLQMPSLVRVTNLDNGRSLVVRVNDRGPYSRGRVIDLSSRAAELLDFKTKGTAKVRLEVLEKESRMIAAAAKAGHDTRGYEVALNQNRLPTAMALQSQEVYPLPTPPGRPPQSIQAAGPGVPPVDRPQPLPSGAPPVQPGRVEQVALDGSAPIQGHYSAQGEFMPDPIVTREPVRPTSIYVQAGAFSDMSNAEGLKNRLTAFGPAQITTTHSAGQTFYRVRLGPYSDVASADRALKTVTGNGYDNAILIVE